MKHCTHCGTAFNPRGEGESFCCRGCEYVFQLIQDSGYGRYYELKRDKTTLPVLSRPFEEHDFAWLPVALEAAESSGRDGVASLNCRVEGISCVGCVWLIGSLFGQAPGGIRAMANPANGNLHLSWHSGGCDVVGFLKDLCRYGYAAFPAGSNPSTGGSRTLGARLGLCAAFALNAMAFSLPGYLGMTPDFQFAGLFEMIAFASATLAMLSGGTYFISRAWKVIRTGTVHMDLPIALGLVAAYSGSIAGWILGDRRLMYFDFVSTFVFLMLLGRMIQNAAVERNRAKLVRLSPLPQEVVTTEGVVALADLKKGCEFKLGSGKSLPVASCLTGGTAEFSLEWIRGESEAVTFHAGSRIPAGAILLDRQAARLIAEESWQDSLIAKLMAGDDRDPGSPVLRKLLTGYLVGVILLGLLVFGGWSLAGKWQTGLQAMISTFVVSCPCALGVAVPLADQRAASRLAAVGAFVRRASLWPRLRRVRHVIFDKTGTLTLERPILVDPVQVSSLDERSALALARLTSGSLHPVSRVLLEALGLRGQRLLEKSGRMEIAEQPGRGVSYREGGVVWSLGKGTEPGLTLLQEDKTIRAYFSFRDELRPSCREALEALRRRGMELHILSGDSQEKVSLVAAALGLPAERAVGNLSPDEKAARVREIDARNTLYIGDGANDSLAFEAAYVTATPVVDRSLLESKSDFYALGSGLSWVEVAFAAGDARAWAVRSAFVFAALYNLAVVCFAASGRMSPLFAAVVMPLSSAVSILIVTFGRTRPSRLVSVSREGYRVSASPAAPIVP